MATVSLSPVFNGYQSFLANGLPNSFGFIKTYAAGSSTPLATYSDSSGIPQNPVAIPLNASGYPPNQIWLDATLSYKFVITDTNSNVIDTLDNIVGYQSLNVFSASNGSSLVGFIQAGTGAVATTVQTELRQRVSVFQFMTAAQIADVLAGTLLVDVTLGIQAAVTYLSTNGGTLFFPQGAYKVTAAINWSPRVNLLGVGGHVGSRIYATHAGNIFQYTNIDFCIVEKLAFDGSGCTAFKQTGVGGNYTQNVTWRDCHFYATLAECIYGNLIFNKIIDNTFGYYGVVGTSHRHIASFGTSTNLTNLNLIEGNRFYNGKGSSSVLFDSGTGLLMFNNNWESNTCLPVKLNGIFNAKVNDNWFEANTVATSEIEINVGTWVIDSTPTEVKRNNFVPSASIVNILNITNALTKVYFDENTGNLTGKGISNDATKIYSQLGNNFTGLTPPGYITQERGTFTLTDGSGAGLTLTGGAGTYTRNDNVITFVVSFTYPATADGSNAKLTGLPYAPAAITPFASVDNSGAAVTFASNASAVTMVPYLVGALTPRTNANMSGKLFYVSGSYRI